MTHSRTPVAVGFLRGLWRHLLRPWLIVFALLVLGLAVMHVAGFSGWVLVWLACWAMFLIGARRADAPDPSRAAAESE